MISTMKVTDGDILLIHMEGDLGQAHVERVREKIKKWIDARGLNNVEIMVTGGKFNTQITKITVNDVFEDEVLKGELK